MKATIIYTTSNVNHIFTLVHLIFYGKTKQKALLCLYK